VLVKIDGIRARYSPQNKQEGVEQSSPFFYGILHVHIIL
jgi:hypothetical protein